MGRAHLGLRLRSGLQFVFALSMGLGMGALLVPLSDLLRSEVAAELPLLQEGVAGSISSLEPQLSRLAVGLLFGLAAWVLLSVSLSGYARVLLRELEARLRKAELLPHQHESLKKRRSLFDAHDGVLDLYDSYVEQLKAAKLEKQKFQAALVSYADPTVAERLRSAQSAGNIRSERRPVAVLFSDIRGFTAMSERLMPEQVVGILNDYFSFAAAAVSKNGGTVNKYIGDAVMALFEQGPAYREGSALKSAVLAALAMQEDFQRSLPQWKQRIPQAFDCHLGVGVHFGDAILGTVGSEERREYTAIGDTVNFASRLCSLAKPGEVRVNEHCFEQLHHDFDGEAQEAVAVKGKTGTHVTFVVRRKRTYFS